jgi:hypothetical protein
MCASVCHCHCQCHERLRCQLTAQTTVADQSQVSNWFINARRRQPEKEKREQEAAAEAAAKIPQGGLADERH